MLDTTVIAATQYESWPTVQPSGADAGAYAVVYRVDLAGNGFAGVIGPDALNFTTATSGTLVKNPVNWEANDSAAK